MKPAHDTPINHNDLLALLEDGPKRAADLADWLGVTRYAVVGVLNQLVFEGLVKRTGTLKKWCLASYRPDFAHRGTAEPIGVPIEDFRACAVCGALSAPPISGFERFCGATCADAEAAQQLAKEAAADARIRVINGQVFEVTWDGRGPIPGSGEAKGLGSTLGGIHRVHST